MIKKIMLIRTSSIIPKDSIRRLMTPLGLICLGAVLREKGYEVNILDSPCEGYENNRVIEDDYVNFGLSDEDIIKRIKEYNPDIVGFTSMFSGQHKNVLYHCNLVKSIDKNIPIVLGGVHPSHTPKESLMSESVDYVIIGEGEYRFLNLLSALNQGKEPDFDGIAYKKDGKIIVKPWKTRIENLDDLPLPARDLIDMKKYIKIGLPNSPFTKEERAEQVITSRGCPFNCVFCSGSQFYGRKIIMRSVDNVLKEIDELVNKYNIQEIQFCDDNFTINKERAKELFRRLKKYNLSWCTPNGIMAQTLDKEMIKLMAESGAYQLTFAIESASTRVLKEIIDKPVPDKQKVKELVDECHKYDVKVHGFFIVGFPGETIEEINKTLQYPFDYDFDSISYYIVSPMVGSRLYYDCIKKGYLNVENMTGDIKRAEINIPKDSPDYVISQEELEKLIDNKIREFNEYRKRKDPEAWEIKHKQFLKKYKESENLILGRVT